MGVSENWGTLFWGLYNKDPTIWGTILGSPIFGNSHMLNTVSRGYQQMKDPESLQINIINRNKPNP